MMFLRCFVQNTNNSITIATCVQDCSYFTGRLSVMGYSFLAIRSLFVLYRFDTKWLMGCDLLSDSNRKCSGIFSLSKNYNKNEYVLVCPLDTLLLSNCVLYSCLLGFCNICLVIKRS